MYAIRSYYEIFGLTSLATKVAPSDVWLQIEAIRELEDAEGIGKYPT